MGRGKTELEPILAPPFGSAQGDKQLLYFYKIRKVGILPKKQTLFIMLSGVEA